MIDPRSSVIEKRLAGVKRVIAVTGWKGGIGKSSIASVLALLLARKGHRTALLDLDFTGASDHIILGINDAHYTEETGINPPLTCGITFMSMSFFSQGRAVPLRGSDVSQAALELLAVTQWGEQDFLVVDMPPGIGDASLDMVRWIKRAELLAVTTPAVLAVETLKRSLALFERLNVPLLGIVENLSAGAPSPFSHHAKFLGAIRRDPDLETATGQPEMILRTRFAEELGKIVATFS
ncbi:MAG: P-loop NTPase [Verrucomicrobiia bacterium]|jgi:ATP-binding protein involved in chromosome partitioning